MVQNDNAKETTTMRQRFVLCDRDGTINVEKHYLSDPDQLQLLPFAASGLRQMAMMGLGLVVVTNQSAIGRGMFGSDRLNVIHDRLRELLRVEGVELDGIYHCPHIPEDSCACRKPAPGMIEQAALDLGFEPEGSFFIGDKTCDIDAGHAAKTTTLLVRTGYGLEHEADEACRPDFVVDDLAAAANVIQHAISTDTSTMASSLSTAQEGLS
jgi:D-glycero-D-manno-heptose 1,7-bisphosphate phosphatase